MTSFLAFLGVSALVICTPGPDTALTIRNTLLGGRGAGLFTALGISMGQTIWALATSVGLVALLIASEPVFLALKYAGAAYLIWLGLHALWGAIVARAGTVADARPIAGQRLRPAAAVRQGLISNLANPKMAMFFSSLLPQFVPASEASLGVLFTLGLAFSAMTFAWLALYAAVVARAGDVLRRARVRRIVEGAMGAVLVALGARLASESR
ncbi:MAG: LysE family translocator [Alphaproteobacteria bacterium]|nr:LysE family translocator [Alphaproteobacteria bacterium]MCW5742464.1 LysE family translocator [Alphaproteobacteria bacterium]